MGIIHIVCKGNPPQLIPLSDLHDRIRNSFWHGRLDVIIPVEDIISVRTETIRITVDSEVSMHNAIEKFWWLEEQIESTFSRTRQTKEEIKDRITEAVKSSSPLAIFSDEMSPNRGHVILILALIVVCHKAPNAVLFFKDDNELRRTIMLMTDLLEKRDGVAGLTLLADAIS